MKKTNLFVPYSILCAILLCAVLSLAGFGGCAAPKDDGKSQADLQRLTSEEYLAFFVSMFPIDNYREEDFATYRGLQTLVLSSTPADMDALCACIDCAYASGNSLEQIYLGLDPGALWQACGRRDRSWNKQLGLLLTYTDSHPETTYEVLLPYPQLSYWLSLSDKKRETTLTLYRSLGTTLLEHANIVLHFIGAEDWLIANPGNYTADFALNERLSHKLMLLNFCDKVYQMNPDTLAEKLTRLSDIIAREKQNPTQYADLSSYYFVFFGDSVMTYDTSSASIPGVVCGLTGASGCNLSQGGCPATADPAAFTSLERMIDAFLDPSPEAFDPSSDFYAGLLQYQTDLQNGVVDGRQLCFVICLGLNDYFGGHPVENPDDPDDIATYSGALRTGVRRLQESRLDARIVVMTPSFCTAFANGSQSANENSGILTDYVAAARSVCGQLQAECADVYADSGIREDTAGRYLADGVHPNEQGRFLLGSFLADFVGGTHHEP